MEASAVRAQDAAGGAAAQDREDLTLLERLADARRGRSPGGWWVSTRSWRVY